MSNTLLSQVTNTWKPRYPIGLGHLGKAYLENKLVYENKNLTEYLNKLSRKLGQRKKKHWDFFP